MLAGRTRVRAGEAMDFASHIKKPERAEYPALTSIWAAAVRATHHFLSETDFQDIHAQVCSKYLPAMDLYAFYYPGPMAAGLDKAAAGCAVWPGSGALPENGLCAGFIGRSSITPDAAARLARAGLARVPAIQVDTLFVDPAFHRRGIGRALLDFTRRDYPCILLDVNEQNAAAACFYAHYGFTTIGRSELDGQGRAYPLLHLYYQAPGLYPLS